MSLYEKRYYTVAQLLHKEHIDSVLDLGCGDGKFLCYLAQDSFFEQIGGVDVSASRLSRAKRRLGDDSRVRLYSQSFLDSCSDFSLYMGIVAMEVIEHLEENELATLFQNIFQLTPSVIIVTTPNREYNWHYQTLNNGLRHSSHRFEFTPVELDRFAEKITNNVQNYIFTTGFCDNEGASQFIIWKKVLKV